MKILVLNCGSSTIKYKMFKTENSQPECMDLGTVETADGFESALQSVLNQISDKPDVVAHRVVHGGNIFRESRILNDVDIAKLEELSPLAPLHNPPAVKGIRAAIAWGVPNIAVFDTAFHATIPEHAFRFALPNDVVNEFGIRRFGFHGISHSYVMDRYKELTGNDTPTIITLHLGSGCSVAAIKNGKCVDTSMGFGPLEGLMMGTRGGDLDPGVLLFLMRQGYSAEKIETILNRESGLKAIAGISDVRELLESKEESAELALEMFCCRVRKYIGSYLAVLEGAEAIVFTGGIGENAAPIRERIVKPLYWAGIQLDESQNQIIKEGQISNGSSNAKAWVIPTDEELKIAVEAFELVTS